MVVFLMKQGVWIDYGSDVLTTRLQHNVNVDCQTQSRPSTTQFPTHLLCYLVYVAQ